MKTASEMTVSEFCAELRRRNELQPSGDNFLLDLANRLADTAPQAPIALLTVSSADTVAGVTMYAPGLPPGEHDLYCEPEATAPYLRECNHEHGSGLMDRQGNGEFTCHECGHTQKIGRGLQPQPTGE